MSLASSPEGSRRAAKVMQDVPAPKQEAFIKALERANRISELPEPYRKWMREGYPNGVSDSAPLPRND